MSAGNVGISTEFVLQRERFVSSLRAQEGDVRASVNRMSAMKINVGLAFDSAKVQSDFQKLLQNLQRQATSSAITVPVNFQQQGAPQLGGPVGAPQLPLGNTGVPAASPTPGLPTPPAPGGGSSSGSLFSGRGGRLVGFMVARAGVNELEKTIGDMNKIDTMTADLSSNNLVKTARENRAIIQEETTGFRGFIRGAGRYGWNYEKYNDLRAKSNQDVQDAERSERQSGLADRAETQSKSLRVQIVRSTQGGAAARLEELKEWQTNETRFENDLKANKLKNTAREAHEQAQAYSAAIRADVAGEQSFTYSKTETEVRNIASDASESTLQSQGRGREAGYASRRRGIQSNLESLRAEYAKETDPTKKAAIGRVLAASTNASFTENAAINEQQNRDEDAIRSQGLDRAAHISESGKEADLRAGGRTHAAELSQRNFENDEQLRKAGEAWSDENDPVKKLQREKEFVLEISTHKKEQAAIAASEERRISDETFKYQEAASHAWLSTRKDDLDAALKAFDEETEHEKKKLETPDEKDKYQKSRDAQRAGMQDQVEASRASRVEQARDILLRATGHAGLADEDDIEDELARNLHEAGGDKQGRASAVALAISRAKAFVAGTTKPQRFSSFADYNSSTQDAILNTDAEGLKKAQALIQNLDKNGNAIAGGQKFAGEDSPFGKAAGEFNDASDKFAKAVDAMNNNAIFILKPA